MLDAAYVQENPGSPQGCLDRAIEADAQIADWLRGSEQCLEIKNVPSVSYLNDNFVGNGFVMLGDASLFIDPIFSAGVQFCLRGADLASEVISEGLKNGDVSEAALKPYETRIRRPMDKMYKVISNWYEIMRTKDRNNLFARSMRAPLLREQLVIILSGGYDRADLDKVLHEGEAAFHEGVAPLIHASTTAPTA